MKTGLTQRGWNNVLIFASLFMIILFNSTHQKFVESEDETQKATLIKVDAIIQSMDFSGVKIERIGASWRVVSSFETSKTVDAEKVTSFWQQAQFEQLNEAPELLQQTAQYPVIIFAHGYEQAQIFEVMLEPQNDLAYVHHKSNGTWFVLNHSEALMLLPSSLL